MQFAESGATVQGRRSDAGKPDSFLGAYEGLRNWYGKSGQHWEDANQNPLRANEHPDDPELLTRHEIQEACPDLLVTNYSMLEYMLLRPLIRLAAPEAFALLTDIALPEYYDGSEAAS